MRAAVFTELGQPLSVEEVEHSPPGPRDVVVRVGASGVCHSDLPIRAGVVPYPASTVLGHEGAGTVEWVGAEVDRVAVGDRAVARFVPSCGSCFHCCRNESHLCEPTSRGRETPRFRRGDSSSALVFAGLGTFADTIVVDHTSVVAIRSELPDEQLVLLGCGVTTGIGAALNTAGVEPGSYGGRDRLWRRRPVGGPGRPHRRRGSDHRRRSGRAEMADGDRVRGHPHASPRRLRPGRGGGSITVGRGVDCAFEVIGLPHTIRQAYDMARRGGTAVVVGMSRVDAEVTFRPSPCSARRRRSSGRTTGRRTCAGTSSD